MKVIVAGLSKTGTKTMAVALQELGYSVYDFLEQYSCHGKDWERILTSGGTTEDFRKMFENIDAVTDIPAAYYWDEIHAAFPDAKIILTIRNNEETWWKSFLGQILSGETPMMKVIRILSPTFQRLRAWRSLAFLAVFGWSENGIKLGTIKPNESLIRMSYRRHNAHVVQNAPKDKLLVYSVEEGWEPLCKFLNKPVPSKSFPHRNVGGNIVKELFTTNPIFIRIKREATISSYAIVVLMFYGSYKIASHFFPMMRTNWISNAKSFYLRLC